MKTIVELNTFDYGSTGNICFGIKNVLEKNGVNTFLFFERWKGKKKKNAMYIGTRIGNYLSSKLESFGFCRNFIAKMNTHFFINKVKKIDPDIIHLHNLHNGFLDFKKLFDYLKQSKAKVVWTLHDCWGFTGRCPHFLLTNCKKWQTGCFSCPYPKNKYPYALVDYSQRMWRVKKDSIANNDLILVTPSKWLSYLVKDSFLKTFPSFVINNGIDLFSFRPTYGNFRQKHNISSDKFIILGVSLGWSYSKGLDVFIKLSGILPENYQIVLVGVDNKSASLLPENIISIYKTFSKIELAEIYSESNLFLNPTREDNFPTVNLESLACGTPVLTSNIGGCSETIAADCGVAMDFSEIEKVRDEIVSICEQNRFSKEMCIKHSLSYDLNARFEEYYALFKKITQQKEA